MSNIKQLHWRRLKDLGSPCDHTCNCGNRATAWAYRHTGFGWELRAESGSPYSEFNEDYKPMCSSCHNKMDWGADRPRRLAATQKNVKIAHQALRDRWQNPEFSQEHRPRVAEMGKTYAATGLAAITQRIESDPAFAEKMRQARKAVATTHLAPLNFVKFSCSECGMVSNKGGIGTHQKASGHQGRDHA